MKKCYSIYKDGKPYLVCNSLESARLKIKDKGPSYEIHELIWNSQDSENDPNRRGVWRFSQGDK